MSTLVESLKRLYKAGRLTAAQIAQRVEKGTITPAEYEAAAAAGSLRRGAAPELALPDGGEEKLEPKWIVTVDGRDLWKQED